MRFPNGMEQAEIRCIGRGDWYPNIGICKGRSNEQQLRHAISSLVLFGLCRLLLLEVRYIVLNTVKVMFIHDDCVVSNTISILLVFRFARE